MITAVRDGWTELRRVTFRRDGGCLAVRVDVFGSDIAPDMCQDGFGNPILWYDLSKMEFDHVKEQLGTAKKAPDDEAHGITVCPWHHRLSQQWRSDSARHRIAERDWLRKHYPEVWGVA